jgi:hypothetical protein
MSSSPVYPKFLSIGIPQSATIDPFVPPIDVDRSPSVKLEEMMQSVSVSEVKPVGIRRYIGEESVPPLWYPREPSENVWLGRDTKKIYEESVHYMKQLILASADSEVLNKLEISEIERKLIPPHFTMALSYLKTRRLV